MAKYEGSEGFGAATQENVPVFKEGEMKRLMGPEAFARDRHRGEAAAQGAGKNEEEASPYWEHG
eukprot:11171393-Lingulodinium_polyedra.AAC.1